MIGTNSPKHFALGLCIFRRDLRIDHNPALSSAIKNCNQVIGIYDDIVDKRRPLGINQQWWLTKSLALLKERLETLKIKLVFKPSDSDLCDVAKALRAGALFWNHLYLRDILAQDELLQQKCSAVNITTFKAAANLLLDPWEIKNKAGKPFRVFTPFYKQLSKQYKTVEILHAVPAQASSLEISAPGVLAEDFTAQKFEAQNAVSTTWNPGEIGAQKTLQKFCAEKINAYQADRDFLAKAATSALSPHLHFGEISPTQILAQLVEIIGKNCGVKAFVRQLFWREFAWNLLYHFPEIETENFNAKFNKFAWTHDQQKFELWQNAVTGYPVVDAAMTELKATGIMHNRARMVVASFLVKDLMLHWRLGEDYFWKNLVDADEANNLIGWQWTAGSGPDPAPFFRIFNPMLQGKKFDPDGAYVRKWLPVLAQLGKKYIHEPWKAPIEILMRAGIVLGKNYPFPIVDHRPASKKALEAYRQIK